MAMLPTSLSGLREIEQWLNERAAEAQRLLPDLLELPASALCREFRARPELRTPGMLQLILSAAREAMDRFPARAHELTVVAVRNAGQMIVPAALANLRRVVQGQAWRDYAQTLVATGRPGKAQRALAVARAFFAGVRGSAWHLTTVDLVEAPLLDDLGRHEEALAMIGRASYQFACFHDAEGFVQARMLEAAMFLAAGDPAGAAKVWHATQTARVGKKLEMPGRLAAKIGLVELRHGHAAEAAELLRTAVRKLDEAGLHEEAIRAHWHYAEATAARAPLAEALSEYYLVRGEMLLRGKLVDAAAISVEVLDLLVCGDRMDEVAPLVVKFLHELRDSGLSVNALEALAWLRGRAETGCLTREDLRAVRAFFGDLRLRPYARFVLP